MFITLCLLVWALTNYRPNSNFYGPRGIYSLILLAVSLALLGRVLLLRQFKIEAEGMYLPLRTAMQPLFLFDITAPLYLAAGVLIGSPAAVLLALITQASLQGFTLLRGFLSWRQACYRISSITLLILISS